MPCMDDHTCIGCGRANCICDRIKLDEVTSLLCRQCRKMESAGHLNLLDPRVTEWWEAHKKADQIRLAKENERFEEMKKSKLEQIEELKKEISDIDVMIAGDQI